LTGVQITYGALAPGALEGMSYEELFLRPQIVSERTLVFCPTARIEPETVSSLLSQVGMGRFDLMFTKDNPHSPTSGQMYRNIQYNYEKMRRIALTEGYDNVFVVESDMVLPENAFAMLRAVDMPVVSAKYIIPLDPPRENVMDGLVVGMGCMLIKREILEGFTFMLEEPIPPDVVFSRYCAERGTPIVRCEELTCGHKRPNGEVWT